MVEVASPKYKMGWTGLDGDGDEAGDRGRGRAWYRRVWCGLGQA